ncbi:MAG: glutamate--tRNA ligase [Legionellales bacterium]|nr:glutamate--tRNA ligase [Legionellales bacterium]|tara:strand:+ start:1985 stop:3370 length:1386 start_codon:yes stop_codon:yes gene_type:complete
MVKTRFAPSPTGVMHLGNLRTALVNALFAHGQGGQMLLRVENTDKERSEERYIDQILEDLQWLGVSFDEGPVCQSDRGEVYASYFAKLIEMDLAYPCFCSEQELAIHRKAQLSAGQAPRYPGTCQHLSDEQIALKTEKGIFPTLRFRVPKEKIIRFDDAIFGPKQFLSDDLGDFIIRKNDGGPTFMFCNALDDALMGVTHAFRGEDHITNTPRQLMLLEALDLKAPTYGHFPIILGMDGKPLSKRNGSQSVVDLRAKGYLPEAILNYVARLGHSYESTDFMTTEDLGKNYQLSRVGTAPAKFDLDQLNYWQDTTWQHLSNDAIYTVLQPVMQIVPEDKQETFVQIIKQNIRFAEDAQNWAAKLYGKQVDFDSEALEVIEAAGTTYFITLGEELRSLTPKEALNATKEKLGVKGKALFMPFRIALTGTKSGPSFDELYELLSREAIQARVEQALSANPQPQR